MSHPRMQSDAPHAAPFAKNKKDLKTQAPYAKSPGK